MYWDVLEVRAVSKHRLWLRFADGVTGTLQLNASEFTGVLEPLQDPEFFGQVSLEFGAPSWPGEIDLAPDALYRELQKVNAGPPPVNSLAEIGS
jgi:hypothetical protein